MSNGSERFDRLDLGALGALMALTAALHATAFKLWWLYDDPYILRVALSVPIRSLFTDPEAYQQLSLLSCTPLLPVSFRLDHLLFAFEPVGFITHQLLLLWTTAGLPVVFSPNPRRFMYDWLGSIPTGAGSFLLNGCWTYRHVTKFAGRKGQIMRTWSHE